MRRVRVPGRARAERPRRRLGVGQLRDGAGGRRLRPCHDHPGRAHPRRRGDRLRRASPRCRSRARGRRPDEEPSPASDRRRRALAAGVADGDDPGASVPVLAVALPRARDAGRPLGGLAVSRRRVEEPAPRRGDDGHPDLGRHARGLGLVGRRALLPRRRRGRNDDARRSRPVAERRLRPDLPRGRLRRRDVHARGALLRGPGEAARRGRAPRARPAGREAGRAPGAGRRRAPRTRRPAAGGRPLRRASG